MKVTFSATGSGRTGVVQMFTAPDDGVYHITAAGSEGGGGNAYGTAFAPTGGMGAVITADFSLKAGDTLLLVIGQMGAGIQATAKDGTAGGGGGATFVFKLIPAITDSRFQFTKDGKPFEALIVAAGGGGSNDSAYQNRQDDGLDGVGDTWYSPTRYVAPTSTVGTANSGGGGIQQYITNNAQGFFYSRNNGQSIGGYGSGGSSDDSRAGGGGWYISNYQAYSWCAGDKVSGQTGANSGAGYATIEWADTMPKLITDRRDGATYNTADLNRVARAMLFVAGRLRACGWDVVVNPKTDWTREDFPTVAELERYVKQLRKLTDTLKLFSTTPTVPVAGESKDWLTVQEANDIEKILIDVEDMVQRTIASYFYAGEIYAGEV